jgi:hypothetical protein
MKSCVAGIFAFSKFQEAVFSLSGTFPGEINGFSAQHMRVSRFQYATLWGGASARNARYRTPSPIADQGLFWANSPETPGLQTTQTMSLLTI